MARKEPEVGAKIEHGAHQPLAVFAAGFRNLRNAIEHEHRRQRQLGIAGAEQFASRASQKLVIAETRMPVLHSPRVQVA